MSPPVFRFSFSAKMKRAREAEENAAKRLKMSNKMESGTGTIESITLQNFMCHKNLRFNFGSNVNFIIGQNGSGKSAVLSGIILALGGRSSTTGRTSKLSGFIRSADSATDGAIDKAKIELVLCNRGNFAYKPDAYGEKITIVREITHTGSSFKLKSQCGKVISTQRDELRDILTALNIQIENPVSMLTQESSRSFLLSKEAKGEKLYEFFYRGTGLKLLEESYSICKIKKDEAVADLAQKKLMLQIKETELKQWKKILDSTKKITLVKNELLWAGVIEIERILKREEEQLEKLQNDVKTYEDKVKKCKTEVAQTSANVAATKKKKPEAEATLTECRNKMTALQTNREKSSEALRKYEGLFRSHEKQVQRLRDDKLTLQNKINELHLKNENDLNEEKRERDRSIERLEMENACIRKEIEDLQQKRVGKTEEQTRIQNKMNMLTSEQQNYRYQQRKFEEEIKRLKQGLQNKVNAFGEHTQSVLDEVKRRQREFNKLPVGPIGLYLEVKDPKWCNAVEACLSVGLLKSYCCDNNKDAQVLKCILKKYYPTPPTMIISTFESQMFDVRSNKAQSTYPTVLDMLTVKNHIIANCLIDQATIESIILIDDPAAGQDLMMDHPPRNCNSAYLVNCDQMCLNPYRYYSHGKQNQRSVLSSMRQNDVRSQEENLARLKKEVDNKRLELNELNVLFNQVPVELKNLEAHILSLSSRRNANLEIVKDMQFIGKTNAVDDMQGDLQQLQEECAAKETEMRKYELEVSKCKANYIKCNEELRSKLVFLKAEKRHYDELSANLTTASNDLEQQSVRLRKYESDLKKSEISLRDATTKILESRKDAEQATLNAESTCPRINTERSLGAIRIQLAETEKVVQQESKCDLETLHKKYHEKTGSYQDAKVELVRIEKCILKIEKMLKFRSAKFSEILRATQHSIDLAFTIILRANSFHGHLMFETNERLLAMKVSKTSEKESRENHQTLSGGERSFVTIAFIMALWEKTKTPFRILDEYDVFMDSNNRQLCVDLLIKKALEKEESQFVFLSPLDLPQIKDVGKIKIHKMTSPLRDEI